MPRNRESRLLVVTTVALCLAGCGTGSVACTSEGQALTDGFRITIVALPATPENLTVTACIAHDCRSANATSSNHRATALIEHPGANTTSPVTVTITAVQGKQPAMHQVTRTVIPRYVASRDTRCHPDQHLIDLTLDATSAR